MSSFFSCSNIAIIAAVAYAALVVQQIYLLVNPLHGVEIKEPAVRPLWRANQTYDLVCALSSKAALKGTVDLQGLRSREQVVFEREGLSHSFDQNALEIDLVFLADSVSVAVNNTSSSPSEKAPLAIQSRATQKFFQILRSNSSDVFLHVFLLRREAETRAPLKVTPEMLGDGRALTGSVRLVKYDVIPKHFRKRFLLADFGLVNLTDADAQRLSMHRSTVISFWKPEVSVKLVADFAMYPIGHVPRAVARNTLKVSPVDKGSSRPTEFFFKPSLFVDEIGLTSDKYVHLNDTVQSLPLKISVEPMSPQRWFLMAELEQAFETQKSIGFSEHDIDDIRRMVSDTSIYFLSLTMLASLLHLVFEFLAFRSDISFWQGHRSLAGISSRSLVTDLISQVIVFLYLHEQEASLIVIVPSAFAIAVQVWKVYKAFFNKNKVEESSASEATSSTNNSTEKPSANGPTQLDASDNAKDNSDNFSSSSREKTEQALVEATLEADSFATNKLTFLLFPVVIALSVRSLVYEKHFSWYSWVLSSLTSCVYTFGFVFMIPQLYINYKLKSVSHLPWNYLIYKFLNTFVDDLFAFVIKMPMMHRLSVFRDDLIFLIYLYQRWIYRVDSNRPTEK